jgi:hypothetical protein
MNGPGIWRASRAAGGAGAGGLGYPDLLSTGQITTGTAAAAAGGGTPWSIILPILISLLGDFLGGGDEEAEMFERGMGMKNMLAQLGMRAPYQSPYTGQLDRVALQAILNQLKRTSNWGWPQGLGMDLSFLDLFNPGSSSGLSRNPLDLRK